MSSDGTATKKLLVAYDPARPSRRTGDFVVPVRDDAGVVLLGLKSKTVSDQGLTVYVGKSISVDDVFAKLVDTGRKIDSVSETLRLLETFIQLLQPFRIGSVIVVEKSTSDVCGFRLAKVADAPAVEKKQLP
jgi:hypothetical protein